MEPIKGRPRIELNPEELRRLAVLHCTQQEVAAYFCVSLSHVEKRLHDEPEMRLAWDEGRALGAISLRRQQTALAEKGNATMLIWLGKQLLGQRDNLDLKHAGTGPNGEIELTQHADPIDALESELARVSARENPPGDLPPDGNGGG